MPTGKALIDEARRHATSDAELSRKTGIRQAYLCDVLHDRRTLSPENAALLAEFAGLDPVEALKAQTVENEKNASKRERLRAVLFTWWALGVACAPLPGTSDATKTAIAPSSERLTLYTLWRLCRALRARFALYRSPARRYTVATVQARNTAFHDGGFPTATRAG